MPRFDYIVDKVSSETENFTRWTATCSYIPQIQKDSLLLRILVYLRAMYSPFV